MIELLVECLDAFAAISPPTNQPTDIVFHVPQSSAHIIFIPIRWQFWQFSQDFSSNALLRVFDVIFCFGFDSKHFFLYFHSLRVLLSELHFGCSKQKMANDFCSTRCSMAMPSRQINMQKCNMLDWSRMWRAEAMLPRCVCVFWGCICTWFEACLLLFTAKGAHWGRIGKQSSIPEE